MKERLYALLGLAPEVSEEDALAQVKTLTETPTPDLHAYVAVDSPEYAELRTMAEEGRAAKVRLYEMERASVLDAALTAGRIVPADTEKWTKRYDRDPETAREILAELSPRVDFSERGSGSGGGETARDVDNSRLKARAQAYQADHPEMSYRECLLAASKEA